MHIQATQTGERLGRSSIPFDVTGHSLGGGLAAAAALESGHHAVTFNATGVNPLMFNDPTRPGFFFPTAALNYQNRNAFIDTYSVWYVRPNKFMGASNVFDLFTVSDCPDVLTALQFAFSTPGPNAIVTTFRPDGVFHPIEGLIDLTNEEFLALEVLLNLTNSLRTGQISYVVYVAAVLDFYVRYGEGAMHTKINKSHRFPHIYFGMLHVPDGWNAYDHNPHPGF